MQSQDFGRTYKAVEPSRSLATSFSSIEQALFAALEVADRDDKPCIVCGLASAEPARWARGTSPVPIAEPLALLSPKVSTVSVLRELCEPDMIFRAQPPLASSAPSAHERSTIMVALGAILMAAGAHYIFSSLGIRR